MGSIACRGSVVRLGVALLGVLSSVSFLLIHHAEASQLKLALFASPGVVIGYDEVHIFAQVQDAAGNPVCVSQPVTITLSSSNPAVLRPYYSEGDERGLIKLDPRSDKPNVGHTIFKATDTRGTTTVTASAPGFDSGSVGVTTLPRPERWPPAYSVRLYARPPVVPASGMDLSNYLVVQTLDAAGNPTIAERRFGVTIKPSDPSVADERSWFYAPSGSWNSTHLGTTKKAGVVTLTVTAEGLKGESVRIQTFSCPAGSTVTALQDPRQPLPPPPPRGPGFLEGVWGSNIGFEYRITQDGDRFTWYVDKTRETGSGTIAGTAVSASWSGGTSRGSATGHVSKTDAAGRPIEIRWSNGVVFTRPELPVPVGHRVMKACLVGLYNRWTDCDTGQASESPNLIPGVGTLIITDGGKAVTLALSGGAGDYTVEVLLSTGVKVRVALIGPDAQNVRLLEDGKRMGWRLVGNRLVLP